MLIYLIVLELCPGQSSKGENEQRAITPKLGKKSELWFFYNSHLLNEIYLPTKFHVDTSCCFKVMFRTRIADGHPSNDTLCDFSFEFFSHTRLKKDTQVRTA
jgi:hypothetical protein